MSAFDIDSYFQRIGFSGDSCAPTLDTLRAIHVLHPQAIPFENLDPLLEWPLRLDAASLEQKLVTEGRGGYCFEHNLLFSQVLKTLGFKVVQLAARAHLENDLTARTHMLLLVELDEGTYIADVGYGGQTLTAPLRLEAETEQITPHEPFRLLRMGAEFDLQIKVQERWKPLYRFDLQEQLLMDYEVYNWYTSTHPDSLFVNHLIAARSHPGGRYTLRNGELAAHRLNGETARRGLTSAEELRQALENTFLVNLPDDPRIDRILRKVVTRR